MEKEKEEMDVGIMGATPASLFFKSEFEKTPSPEKEEEASRVDFSHLDESLAKDVAAIPERKPRAGDKAAVDLPELAVDKDGKVMELVGQKYIRVLLKSPPRTKPLPDDSIEAIRRRTGITDKKELETVAMSIRAWQLLRDIDNDIIRQYLDKGYAYIEIPQHSKRYPASAGDVPPFP